MLSLSVCIEMFWRDLPMHERMRRVKTLGFNAFEFWGWKNKDLDALRTAKEQTGLALAGMTVEPNWALVERLNDKAVLDGFVESTRVAHSLGCTRLICVPGTGFADETFEITRRRVVRKLAAMAKVAENEGITILLEPLNPIVDHKGAWLQKMHQAADVIQEVGSANVKILEDLYHQQVTEGNLIANMTLYAPLIGHLHAAGVPGRHELVGGELDYKAIFAAAERAGYNGYVGLEFSPVKEGDAGLKEAMELV